jgi:hypothetical protein
MMPSTPETLNELYVDRLNTAWDSLKNDIERWKKIDFGEENKVIAHHIQEFSKFSQAVYEALISRRANGNPESQDFRAIVIGVLTAHWTLLRQVATQRIEGSPYLNALQDLDKLAIRYFHVLRDILPDTLKEKVDPCAPAVYLGDISMLTIYNQKPLVLSMPFNAIDNDSNAKKSEAAISHEIAHAILLQVPEILDELNGYLSSKRQSLSERRRILDKMISGWLEEILADMIGTALAGNMFLLSAMWITATSEINVGSADVEHPPTVVRPFIHLKVLEHLDAVDMHKNPRRKAQITELQESYGKDLSVLRNQLITKIVGDRLDRQFKSIPALTFVTLKEVKNDLENLVIALLKSKEEENSLPLQALGGETIGDLLVKCARYIDSSTGQTINNELIAWGDIQLQVGNPDGFILPISGNLATVFHTPMTLSKGFCDWLPFLPFCRR